MKASEALKSILSDQGKSQRSLALDLEITPQALDNRLSGDMKSSTLCETAALLGYRVALVPDDPEMQSYVIQGK